MNIHRHMRYFVLIAVLFISVNVFGLAIKSKAYDDSLTQRLNGYVLLQVEDNGEAWYVDPVDDARIYMRDGRAAYDVMANLGLGISDTDLAKIRVGIDDRFDCVDTDGDDLCDKLEEGLETNLNKQDTDGDSYDDRIEVLGGYDPLGLGKLNFDQGLADRLRGRIVLQVEKNGQAWYINPQDGLRYYMKDGEAAYQIMRFLSLGISNNDLGQIPISSYEIPAQIYLPPIEEEEEIDGPDIISDPICGNFILELGEECDGIEGIEDGYQCTDTCILEFIDDDADGGSNDDLDSIFDPICGNDILEDGEECDGAGGVEDGYQCTDDCILEEVLPLIDYSANILQAYENSHILVHSDVPEGSSYQLAINGLLEESAVVPTTFLAHFDSSLILANDESPLNQEDVSFEVAKFSSGMTGVVEYPLDANIDFDEGTIDLYLILKSSLDSVVFDTEPYIFKYRNDETSDSFSLLVHSSNKLSFTIYDHSRGWSNAVQTGTSHYDTPINKAVSFTMTWSAASQVAKFYMNGEQIARKDFDGDFPNVVSGLGDLVLGNSNVILDEFRILNKPLSTDEVRENYKRGIPFSDSDIIYSGNIANGQDIGLVIDTDQGSFGNIATVSQAKLEIASPDGYFVPYTDNISIQFSTPSAMTCRYGDAPALYDDLPQQVTGTGTSHSITKAVQSIVGQYAFAIKCQASSGEGDDYGFFRQYRVLPEINNNYPKISKLWWGNAVAEDEVDYLAKFDMTSLSRTNLTRPSIIKQIKEINPNIILLPYKTAVGMQNFSSVEVKSFDDRIDYEWRLQSSEIPGTYCVNYYFPNNLIYNLNSSAPYVSKVAEHLEKDMFDRHSYFDGIWWDVTGPDFWFLRQGSILDDFCDFDLDGIDEDLNVPEEHLLAKEIWADGMHEQMQLSRDRLGQDMITLGNGNGTVHADYNGKLWEENFSPNTFDNFFDPGNTQSFLYWQEHSLEPRINDNLFKNTYAPGSSSYYRYHRYGMTSSLIAGIYYNPTTYNNNRIENWFDEYWVDKSTTLPVDDPVVGRGYLGEPMGDAFLDINGIWRRDFQNGIVLLNHTSSPVSADLVGQFRFITGDEDMVANPGGITENVDLAAYDGRILLRSLCKDNPYDDLYCID